MELSQKHCKWFSQAGVIAQDSDMLFKLGCLATYGGKCIATGCNNKNSYSKYDDFCNFTCSCHAEINVIRKCIKKLGKEKMKRVNLYVARIDNSNNFQNSAPCYGCLRQIKKLKIKKIIFKDDISIKVINPEYYETNHRTFGYYFLKKTIETENNKNSKNNKNNKNNKIKSIE